MRFRLPKVSENDREACALVKATDTYKKASSVMEKLSLAIAIGIFAHTVLAFFMYYLARSNICIGLISAIPEHFEG
jgi:hypothetical protein